MNECFGCKSFHKTKVKKAKCFMCKKDLVKTDDELQRLIDMFGMNK